VTNHTLQADIARIAKHMAHQRQSEFGGDADTLRKFKRLGLFSLSQLPPQHSNRVTVDPYALLNFRIGYDRGTGWSGYLEGRNLFDTAISRTWLSPKPPTPHRPLQSRHRPRD
jgi:hypothetical protein